jgi:hypothetical protein
MIVNETGPLAVFEKLRSYIYAKANDDLLINSVYHPTIRIDTAWRNIDEGINCEYCVSVWVSTIVWLISRNRVIGNMFIGIFGLAGAWMLLYQLVERLEQDDC